MIRPQCSPLGYVAVIAALALAGCDGVIVNRSEIAGGYTGFLYVQQQAAGGTNAVAVHNAPFPPDTVVAALQARYTGNQYRFALTPPADWNGYTVVMSFGGLPIGTQNLCQNPALPQPAPASGTTEVVGDYCYGSILVSEATGRTAAVSGPDDPRFRRLIGDVIAELFSYQARPGDHGQGGGSSDR